MFDRNKPLVTATLGDLEELLLSVMAKSQDKPSETAIIKDPVYKGIEGICKALGVGKTKAQEIKNSGVLDEAIDMVSARIFYVQPELAKTLWFNHQKIG